MTGSTDPIQGYPPIILTGKIGSGKSTVLELMERKGWSTFSADAFIKGLYRQNHIRKNMAKLFPTCSVDNPADRTKMAMYVFTDRILRDKLEGILYPYLWRELWSLLLDKSKWALEIPLWFEKEKSWCRWLEENIITYVPRTRIVLCHATRKVRWQRIKSRGGMNEKLFEHVNRLYASDRSKKERVDWYFNTDRPLSVLERTVYRWLEEK